MLSEGAFKAKKLVRLIIEHSEGKLRKIRITGDFFLYPEDSLEELEKTLRGRKLEKKELMETIREFLEGKTSLGFDEATLSDAILDCVKGRTVEETGSCFR